MRVRSPKYPSANVLSSTSTGSPAASFFAVDMQNGRHELAEFGPDIAKQNPRARSVPRCPTPAPYARASTAPATAASVTPARMASAAASYPNAAISLARRIASISTADLTARLRSRTAVASTRVAPGALSRTMRRVVSAMTRASPATLFAATSSKLPSYPIRAFPSPLSATTRSSTGFVSRFAFAILSMLTNRYGRTSATQPRFT